MEKEKRTSELIIANKELALQNEEKEKRIAELSLKNKELNRVNKQLKKSEINFKSFFNTIDNYLFILDEQGNIIDVNDAVKNKLKYSLEELVGNSILLVHPENRREEAGQIVLEMLQDTRDYCPVPLITKDNKLIPVETYITRGTWNGKPTLFGISKDISQLKASEEKFAKAFQNNPAILGLSKLETGEYIEVNQTFYDKFKMKKEEVIGIASDKIFELDPTFRQKVVEQMKSKGKVSNLETTLRSKNGIELDVLMSADILKIQGNDYNFTTANPLCI